MFVSFIVHLYQNSVSSVSGYWNGVHLLIAGAITKEQNMLRKRFILYKHYQIYIFCNYFQLVYFIYHNKSSRSFTHLLNALLRMLLFSLWCGRLSRPSKYNNHLPSKPIKRTEWLFRNKKGPNRVRPWLFLEIGFLVFLYISMTSTATDTLVWLSCIADLALWLLVHWNLGLCELYKPSDVNHLLELIETLQVIASWF